MQSMDLHSFESQRAARELAKWWWAWLVMGIVWIIVALVILQFTTASVVTVGLVVGAMFLVSGIQSFVVAQVSGGWKWLSITFGVILVVGGIVALFNPVATFFAIANILGFVFALIGISWIVEALSTQHENSLWGLGLASGIIMLVLGFATVDKLIPARTYTLLILAGVWALLHGITNIVDSFRIKRLGEVASTAAGTLPTTGPAPSTGGPATSGPIPPGAVTP